MGKFLRINGAGAGAVVEKDGQVEGLGGLVQVEVATEQRQMRSERRVCLLLGSPRLPRGRWKKSSLEEF